MELRWEAMYASHVPSDAAAEAAAAPKSRNERLAAKKEAEKVEKEAKYERKDKGAKGKKK